MLRFLIETSFPFSPLASFSLFKTTSGSLVAALWCEYLIQERLEVIEESGNAFYFTSNSVPVAHMTWKLSG